MNRRQFLALCGSLGVSAGCVGADEEEQTARTVTPVPLSDVAAEPEPDRERVDGTAVVRAVVQPGVVGFDSSDSIGVYDGAGQYLLVTLANATPDRSAFTLQFDGEPFSPAAFGYGLYRADQWSVRYEDGGPLVFTLPETGDASEMTLSWPGGQWTPRPALRRRLEREGPDIAMSLAAPRSAGPEEVPAVTVTVANKGATAGRYVAALNQRGPELDSLPVARITGSLDAGASTTHMLDAEPPDPTTSTTYILDVPNVPNDIEHTIYPSGY